jgi:hypothetical protein
VQDHSQEGSCARDLRQSEAQTATRIDRFWISDLGFRIGSSQSNPKSKI